MCLFCNVPQESIIAETHLAFAIRDGYPVTHLHTLIIPKRHATDFLGLEYEERDDCNILLDHVSEDIVNEDESVVGFNIGMNVGQAAGQTIFHAHIHLIPRKFQNIENPRGGVRNVIPDKGDY